MKSYPSISTKFVDGDIIAFDKLDGSNIRAEWSKKKGFYKFGSRTQLLDDNNPILSPSKLLFLNKYNDDLSKIFVEEKYERVVVFFEFFGENSIVGRHERNDNHDVVLFDVDVYKRGLLPPEEFVKIYGHLHIPNILYEGKLTKQLVTDVKMSQLKGMTHEGVVCKLTDRKVNTMFKIKSRAWLDQLNDLCNGDQRMFNRLK